ncbi:hypothetical protein GDO78_015981 [Eleutherodactylus coqui]|uniref:Uncharacterized protein n=1 Tax=Eleutherodactylus coqui TaxID=57060 RepID=A0A8J6B207_ELECQ|nr:hypothetical protein GDO78_015981 [Eleutherodactylus coqui]
MSFSQVPGNCSDSHRGVMMVPPVSRWQTTQQSELLMLVGQSDNPLSCWSVQGVLSPFTLCTLMHPLVPTPPNSLIRTAQVGGNSS